MYLLRISATDGGGLIGQTTVRVNVHCQSSRHPVFIMNEYKANIYAASHHGSSVIKVAIYVASKWSIKYNYCYAILLSMLNNLALPDKFDICLALNNGRMYSFYAVSILTVKTDFFHEFSFGPQPWDLGSLAKIVSLVIRLVI